jgi:SAM-dependent MidA family methyltransferase
MVGARILADGGAALFIDYGRDKPGLGDTLQALRRHQRVDPLHTAGSADVTVHADFPSFVEAASNAGAKATDIVPQARFLASLGLEARATALAKAHPNRTDRIAREVARLTGPDQMGQLFKVVALHSSSILPPGF